MAFLPAIIGAAGAIGTAAAGMGNKVGEQKDQFEDVDPNNYQLQTDDALDWYKQAGDARGRDIGFDPYAQNHQQSLVKLLEAAASGKGPSAAEATLNQGRDASIKAAMALAGSSRGSGLGAAQLNATNAGTQATLQAANEATAVKAREQQQAVANLGNVLGGMRSAGASEAIANAKRKDDLETFYMTSGLNREQAQAKARMTMEQERTTRMQGRQAVAGANAAQKAKWLAGVGQGFSSLGAAGGGAAKGAGGEGGGGEGAGA